MLQAHDLMKEQFTEEEIQLELNYVKKVAKPASYGSVLKGMLKLKYENVRPSGYTDLQFVILQFMIKYSLFLLLDIKHVMSFLNRLYIEDDTSSEIDMHDLKWTEEDSFSYFVETEPILGKRERNTPVSSPAKTAKPDTVNISMLTSCPLDSFNSYKVRIESYLDDALDVFRTFLVGSAKLIVEHLPSNDTTLQGLSNSGKSSSRRKKSTSVKYQPNDSLVCFKNARYTISVFLILYDVCRRKDDADRLEDGVLKREFSFSHLISLVTYWNKELVKFDGLQGKPKPAFLHITDDINAIKTNNMMSVDLKGCCVLFRYMRISLKNFMSSEEWKSLVAEKKISFSRTSFDKQEIMMDLRRVMLSDVADLLTQPQAS